MQGEAFTPPISINIHDLPREAFDYPQYPLNTLWPTDIYPLVRHDQIFADLVKQAFTKFSEDHPDRYKLPTGWRLWVDDGPWKYTIQNDQFLKHLEPKEKSASYFKVPQSCHRVSIPLCRAVQLLRPDADVRIAKAPWHTCVIDTTNKEVFDLLWFDWKQALSFVQAEKNGQQLEITE